VLLGFLENSSRLKPKTVKQPTQEDRTVKKILTVLAITVIAVFAVVSFAGATAKLIDITPSCDANGNVTIPTLPSGATLANVWKYDDVNGTPPEDLGAVSTFNLKPGQGFNFEYTDSQGTWFQLITPQSKAGNGLAIDKSWKDEQGIIRCKYIRPLKK
jgi:hypothetical protein